jgi:hypothetical protein
MFKRHAFLVKAPRVAYFTGDERLDYHDLAKSEDKQHDYMAYPNRNHGLSEGSGTALHLRMLVTRYLIRHLPLGPR